MVDNKLARDQDKVVIKDDIVQTCIAVGNNQHK